MEENKANLVWGMRVNTYCMLLHLSQLASIVVPGLGVLLAILMWALNKDQFPEVDRQGKVALNWIISAIIYSLICMATWIFVIGIIAFVVLAVCNVIFVIIAAVKANDNVVWEYPLSIKFFKVEADVEEGKPTPEA